MIASPAAVPAPPSVLLIGATGPTGRAFLAAAAAAGVSVRAPARDPAALGTPTERLEVVRGDVRDAASLARAVAGVDVVVSVLGTRLTRKPVSLLSEGTTNLVAAMRGAGVSRLVCVTGMGAGDSRGHGGFLYDRIVLPLLLGSIYADKDRQEAVVRASGLDWTIVRPAWLTDGPSTGRYRILTDLDGLRLTRISRADVADFLLREAVTPAHSRLTVNLTD